MGRARGLSWEGGPALHASVFLSRLWRSLEAAKARGTPPPARPPVTLPLTQFSAVTGVVFPHRALEEPMGAVH